VAVAQQPADLVERIVFHAAVTEGVLLDAAADLVDDLGAEFHDMKRIEHRDGVGQFVADRDRIPPKRVKSSVLDSVEEVPGSFSEPAVRAGARRHHGPDPLSALT
jgi:hypothetical protein